MINRLLGAAGTLLVYACVATVVSQAIILAYLVSAWKIDGQRWLNLIAAAQGIQPASAAEAPTKAAQEKTAEQASLDQILEARALKYRNLELREQELRNGLSQLQTRRDQAGRGEKRLQAGAGPVRCPTGVDARRISGLGQG